MHSIRPITKLEKIIQISQPDLYSLDSKFYLLNRTNKSLPQSASSTGTKPLGLTSSNNKIFMVLQNNMIQSQIEYWQNTPTSTTKKSIMLEKQRITEHITQKLQSKLVRYESVMDLTFCKGQNSFPIAAIFVLKKIHFLTQYQATMQMPVRHLLPFSQVSAMQSLLVPMTLENLGLKIAQLTIFWQQSATTGLLDILS